MGYRGQRERERERYIEERLRGCRLKSYVNPCEIKKETDREGERINELLFIYLFIFNVLILFALHSIIAIKWI